MHASNCDHCGGFKRLIGEMYICTHCDPVILSTVSLRNKTVELHAVYRK